MKDLLWFFGVLIAIWIGLTLYIPKAQQGFFPDNRQQPHH